MTKSIKIEFEVDVMSQAHEYVTGRTCEMGIQ